MADSSPWSRIDSQLTPRKSPQVCAVRFLPRWIEMDTTPNWQPGDRVYWLHEHRGGYGYTDHVNAIVKKVGPKRITVTVARYAPYPDPHHELELRGVNPEKLRVRTKPCAELGEKD